MKNWAILILVVAAGFVGWWWWRKRSGQPFLPAVVASNVSDPLQAYIDSLLGTNRGQLPPVAPTGSTGLQRVTEQLGSITVTKATVDVCVAKGGDPKLCATLAPVADSVGRWLGTKVYDAGSVAKKGLKAIVPFW